MFGRIAALTGLAVALSLGTGLAAGATPKPVKGQVAQHVPVRQVSQALQVVATGDGPADDDICKSFEIRIQINLDTMSDYIDEGDFQSAADSAQAASDVGDMATDAGCMVID